MTDLADPIAAFESAFTQLLSFVETLPDALQEQAGAVGRWSPHDVLAHQAGWLMEAKRRFQRFPTGTGDAQYNVEAFNKVFAWQREGQSWESTLAEVHAGVQELAEMGRALPENEIKRNGTRYEEWFTSMAQDANQHHTTMTDWASAQSSDN